jgi:hypothetical protein
MGMGADRVSDDPGEAVPVVLRRRTPSERLAYLAGRLRDGEDPSAMAPAVALALDMLADELAGTGTRPGPIPATAFLQALEDAGVIHPGDRVGRVVIDAQAGHLVRVYVERAGDERLLSVALGLDGVEVTGSPAAVEGG